MVQSVYSDFIILRLFEGGSHLFKTLVSARERGGECSLGMRKNSKCRQNLRYSATVGFGNLVDTLGVFP